MTRNNNFAVSWDGGPSDFLVRCKSQMVGDQSKVVGDREVNRVESKKNSSYCCLAIKIRLSAHKKCSQKHIILQLANI